MDEANRETRRRCQYDGHPDKKWLDGALTCTNCGKVLAPADEANRQTLVEKAQL